MESFPKTGLNTILLKDYIEAFNGAKLKYDGLFLDNNREVHLVDIFDNFLNDYYKENTDILELDDDEIAQYMYSPILLSQDLYNTPDLWRILMKCNGLIHPGEMDFSKPFRVPKLDNLIMFFSKIDTLKDNLGGAWEDYKDILAIK